MHKFIRPLSIVKYVNRCYVTCLPIDPIDPGTQLSILSNGIRVATEYQPTALSCISLFVEAGPRFENACNNGITHFLEHMAYKGFCSMTQCQLEENGLYTGAKMTAQTTREIQTFSGIFQSEQGPLCTLNKLASVITEMELDQSAVDAEKYNICLEMLDEDNDPRAVTFDYLHQAAFQGTPLAQRVIGPTKNVRRFDREFAFQFLSEHYQPYKICIATAGKVDHEQIVSCVEARMGCMPSNPMFESDEGPTRYTGSQIIYRDDSMSHAHVAIAFEAPGYMTQEYFPLLVASNMMGKWHKSQGGADRNASLLAQAAACDDICESFESFYIAYRDIGLWGVYWVANQMDLEDMLERIQNQWMHLCITTQHAEMERAVNLTKLAVSRGVTGVVNSCNDVGTQVLYTCTRRSLQDKLDKLSAVKTSTIRECAEKILYDRCPTVAAVGPTENLPEYNRIRAGQYWLRF